ncbi:hypothetical protein N7540_003253 [Penicillium herquei]|nr:hypothetical protein N7540_003253 [Penicillium herquei]
MAYMDFNHCDHDMEDWPPIFLDTDDSPVHETPDGFILQTIIECNDLSALNRYNESPHSFIFAQKYEIPGDDPFSLAFGLRSFDALRALIDIYKSDTSLTEPLNEYAHRISVSFVHKACAAGDQELVLW